MYFLYYLIITNYYLLLELTNEKCDVNDNNWPGVRVGTFGELFIKSVISKSENSIVKYLNYTDILKYKKLNLIIIGESISL